MSSSQANTSVPSGPRAGRREWLGLAVLALPTVLLALDTSVLYLALPHLATDLEPSSAQALWAMDIYGFMIAGFLITMGTLGDRIGRRKLLLFGAGLFGATSVLAAYSVSAEMLIAARAAQGVAGATLMPATLALISDMFLDPRQRAVAIAGWVSSFMTGIAIGPIVGGVLLEFFWWGSVFLLGVPVMVLLLILGPLVLPERRSAEAGPLDLTSVGLSLAALLPGIYALKRLAEDGLGTAPVLAGALGVAAGWLFLRRQRGLRTPLVDPSLFASVPFSAALLLLLLGGTIEGGVTLFVTQYLQLIAGLSPLSAGLWLVPSAAAVIATSMVAPLAARRFPSGYVIAAGLLLSIAGLLVLTQVSSAGGLAGVVAGFTMLYAGGGPYGALGTDLVVGAAPPQKAGSAGSMAETVTELGAALGVAVLGSVGTAVYRQRMAGAVPDSVPPEAAGTSHDSLAGATAAAAELPPGAAAELLDSARQAFTAGLNAAAGGGAAVAVALAVAAAVLLRNVRLGAGSGQCG
ncbi:DHA2 family multidrug resistance protein-like MFS transporter [Lipingzhangella halophila]|uniref:DHA2 family multidrug resistance protein-like MFS transporter n=1 Tax=Lipingzhangella halophila TaxID=1783352 RepID=A0A7W7W1K4_9ACTN|nr:MFS transporter [Lipingzhangella halophila]MBB4931077.1 DHA2 family multidrug resistance protein-like MFS transporter [Lipingzhangella halophila]